MRCFTWRHRAEHGGLPRDGGRRCDMLGLRAARHRSCPILRRLDSVMCIRRRFHRERLFPCQRRRKTRPLGGAKPGQYSRHAGKRREGVARAVLACVRGDFRRTVQADWPDFRALL